ncbi:MAG: hypothetical protein JWM74_204 [Myxococcaceae bacterium]|nr:hypothetical protein [Myxococcaceae bacterium]
MGMKRSAFFFSAALVLVAAPSFADDSATRADTKTAPAVAAGTSVSARSDLARIVSTTAASVSNAGTSRPVAPPSVHAAPVERPVATPRLLRRMSADRVRKDLESRAQTCAGGVPAKTWVVLRLSVAPNGEVESVNGVAGSGATDLVVACVWSAARAVTFVAPGTSVDVDLSVALTPTHAEPTPAVSPAPNAVAQR